jgi:hypothetical protein
VTTEPPRNDRSELVVSTLVSSPRPRSPRGASGFVVRNPVPRCAVEARPSPVGSGFARNMSRLGQANKLAMAPFFLLFFFTGNF